MTLGRCATRGEGRAWFACHGMRAGLGRKRLRVARVLDMRPLTSLPPVLAWGVRQSWWAPAKQAKARVACWPPEDNSVSVLAAPGPMARVGEARVFTLVMLHFPPLQFKGELRVEEVHSTRPFATDT